MKINQEKTISKKIATNTIWMYMGFVVNAIIYLLTIPFFIYKLGVDSYGVFSIVSVVIGYVSLVDFGIGTFLIKFIAEYRVKKEYDKINKMISTSFILYLVLGFIGCGIILIFSDFFVNSLFHIPINLIEITKIVFIITSISFFYSLVFGVFSNIITGLQRFDISNIIQIIVRTLGAIAAILVLWIGYGLIEFVIVTALFGVIGITINVIIAKKLMPEIRLFPRYFDIGLIKIMIGFSFSIFITNMLGIVIFNIDKLLIGIFLPIGQITIYTIGATLALFVLQISLTFTPTIVPAVSELNTKNDKNAIKELILRGTKFALLISTPLTVIIFTLASPIVKFWVGADFTVSIHILQILILGFFVNTFTHAFTATLVGIGKIKIYVYYSIISVIMNISLSTFLLLRIGVIGAALGTSITMIILSSIFTLYLFKRFDISLFSLIEKIKNIIIICICLFILIYFLNNYFPPINLFWLLIYVCCITIIYFILAVKFILDTYEKKIVLDYISLLKQKLLGDQ